MSKQRAEVPSKEVAAAPAQARRKRRSTEEILQRILEAAAEEFEQVGYANATTASIAKKAGVAEPLLFTNFGSKARLFNDSVFKPLSQHLVRFCEQHLPKELGGTQSRDELRRRYILELEQFVDRHSRKLASILFVHLYGRKDGELGAIHGLQDYFRRASDLESFNRRKEGGKVPPDVLAKLSFTAIFSCILLRDWLFPEGEPAKAAYMEALADFVIDGLNANS